MSVSVKERSHAIDALRVFAMISVVFLHASISYMTVRLPDLLWAVHDPGGTSFFNGLFFWIRGLTMRVFFLVAGFFAVKLYEEKGAAAFLENRRKRILIPFAVGTAVLVPIVYFVWCTGWLQTGQCEIGQALRTRFDEPIQRNIYGPIHLWFLEFLLIYYAVFYLWRRLKPDPRPQEGRSAHFIFSFWRPLYWAVPSILILWFDGDVVINFRNTFWPHPLKLLYYGVFFAFGVQLYRFRGRLGELARFSWVYLAASVPVYVWMSRLLENHLASALTGADYAALVASISLFAWLSVFGFFGLALKLFNRENPALRYLSGASYWIYLSHLPVVGALQIALLGCPIPAGVKFLLVVSGALCAGFLTYEGFVRRTSLGACLNGTKPEGLSLASKIFFTLLLLGIIAASGISFQRFYNKEKICYEETVAGYYRKYLKREADPVGLRHWTMWAIGRWGLAKTEQQGFIESEEYRLLRKMP